MKDRFDPISARQDLLLNERIYTSPIVKKATQFLREARNEEGAWGYYKKTSTDVYISSLAIEALRLSKMPEFEAVSEDAIARLENIASGDLNDFSVLWLVGLLNVVSMTGERNSEIERKIVTRLLSLRKGVSWGVTEPQLSLSCRVLLALAKTKKPPQRVITEFADYLCKSQRTDGGWGATSDSMSTLIPTSFAIRVLQSVKNESASKSRLRGIKFLINHLEETGWNKFEDPFEISNILATLAEARDILPEILQDGINALCKRMNDDAGWGSPSGGVSNVEYTALSLIALSLAGENRFVPALLAYATIDSAGKEITQLSDQLKVISKDIDQRVDAEIKNVIAERNDLRERLEESNKRHKNEIATYEHRMEEEREYFALNQRARERYGLDNMPFAAVSLPMLVSIAISLFLYFIVRISNGLLLLTTFIATLIGSSMIALLLLRGRRRDNLDYLQYSYRHLRSPSMQLVVRELVDLMREWAPSAREDFLFRLSRTERDIDPFYARALSDDYGRTQTERARLRGILYELTSLPRSERVAIIDIVRERVND